MMSHLAPNARIHSVYRYFDSAGRVIYIGQTVRGPQRANEHNQHSEFWQYAASSMIETCVDAEHTNRLERALIEAHRPPFNKSYNPDWQKIRRIYLGLVQMERHLADAQNGKEPTCEVAVPKDDEWCSWWPLPNGIPGQTYSSRGEDGVGVCEDPDCYACHAYHDGYWTGNMRGGKAAVDYMRKTYNLPEADRSGAGFGAAEEPPF